MNRDRLIAFIVLVVVVVWAVIALVDLVKGDYRALTIATPVMLLVVGAVLGIRKNGGKH